MWHLKIWRRFLPCKRMYIECKSCGLLRVLFEVLQRKCLLELFKHRMSIFIQFFYKYIQLSNSQACGRGAFTINVCKFVKFNIIYFITKVFFKSWHSYGYMQIGLVFKVVFVCFDRTSAKLWCAIIVQVAKEPTF